MSDQQRYELRPDSHGRMWAKIFEGVEVGIKFHSLTSPERIEHREHAYAVMQIETEAGPLFIRDIRIVWSKKKNEFRIHWRQWKTGRMRPNAAGKMHPEYLDVVGPKNRETRARFTEAILGVFNQINSDSSAGTLGQDPKLQEIRAQLERKEREGEAILDGPVLDPDASNEEEHVEEEVTQEAAE